MKNMLAYANKAVLFFIIFKSFSELPTSFNPVIKQMIVSRRTNPKGTSTGLCGANVPLIITTANEIAARARNNVESFMNPPWIGVE